MTPYSPDLNPIEKCWSKIKTALRAAATRTREALDDAISAAISAVSAQDAKRWFRFCGYLSANQ
jgi:transposase